MNVHSAGSLPRTEPGWFGPAARPRFGWLHRAASPASGVGLVIVPPFGYEAVCAHRSLRYLAETAARAGIAAVRFDLDGTGDSAGDDLEPARVEAWVASIADACDLVRASGASHVVIAGVRMGALLAAVAASRRTDIAGLVAIATVPSGKALVREGRALQMQLGLEPAPAGVAAPPEDVHEVVGFALTAETRTALAALDLTKLSARPAPAVHLIDRDDLPPNDKLAAHLRTLGATVTQERLPGYVEMVLDPHRTTVPTAILASTVAFARSVAPLEPAPPVEAAIRPRAAVGDAVEEVQWVDSHVFGVSTRPAAAAAWSGRAVILLNAGAVGRIGPNRLGVELARRLAARGDLVLRIDQSGIGDSPTRDGGAENTVYSAQAVGDVGAAVAWARGQGASRVAVAGLCSGAYHALKTAVANHPVDAIAVINPLTFQWEPGLPLDFAAFRVTADAKRYGTSVRSAASWKKVLRGEVDVKRVARVMWHRARGIAEHRAKDALRRLRVPLRDDLGTDLLALGRRGVALRFIFAAADPGHAMLVEQGGVAVPQLTQSGAMQIEIIDGPDHTFTPRWSHARFLDAVARAVSP